MSINTKSFIEADILDTFNLNEINGSAVGDILLKMNISNENNKLFFQSGISNERDTGLCISLSNNIGFGTTDIKEKVDVSGAIITDNYKLPSITIPIIDINSDIKTPGYMNISKGLSINDNKFIVDVSGNTKIFGNLDISSNLNLNNVFGISSNGNFTTKGKLDTYGSLNINNNFTVSNTGDVLIKGLLDVKNKTTFNSDVSLNNGILDVGTNHVLYIDNLNNRVGIGGIPDTTYNFHVKGNTKIKGNLVINGTTSIQDTINNTVTSFNLTNNGTGPAVIVNQLGDQAIANFTDDNNSVLYIANNGLIGVGKITPSYNLDISGTAFIKQNLSVSNGLNLSIPSSVARIAGVNPIILNNHTIVNNSVDISQGIVINDKLNVDASGNIDTSGNVKVSGALTINGNFSQLGIFTQDGDIDVSGNALIKYNLDISKNLRINGDQFMVDSSSGNILSKGTMDISGYLNVNNKFIIDSTGNITSSGALDISKNFSINQTNLIIDSSGNLKSKGHIDVSNNFIVNTNKFKADSNGNVQILGTLDISNNLTVNTNNFTVNSETGVIQSAGNVDISQNFSINTNKFVVNLNGNVTSAGTLDISNNLAINNNKFIADSSGNIICASNFDISDNFSVNTNSIIIDKSGNILSKNSLTGVQKFSINNNNFSIDTSSSAKARGNFDLSQNLNVGTGVFKTNINNNYIGINTYDSSNNNILDISGNVGTSTGFFGDISNSIVMSHRDYANNTQYLVKQSYEGEITINSKSLTETIDICFDNIPKCVINSDGDMTIQGAIYAYSDIRIKENVHVIENALEKVKALQGVKYNFIYEDETTHKKHIGLLAQDVELVAPEAIETDGEIKTVAYNNLIGLLIQAIKELYCKYKTI